MKIAIIVWSALILFIGFCIMPEMVFALLAYFCYSMYRLLK